MRLIFTLLLASVFFCAALASLADFNVFSKSVNSELLRDCSCIHENCGCCEYLDWHQVGINARVCANFSYIPHDYGVSITVTYNSVTLFNETVSARNPPPICFGIPDLEKFQAHMCVRFYDLNLANKHFHGCAKMIISVYHVIHKSIDLGCFNIPDVAALEAMGSRELRVLTRGELKKLKYSNNEMPFVNMI